MRFHFCAGLALCAGIVFTPLAAAETARQPEETSASTEAARSSILSGVLSELRRLEASSEDPVTAAWVSELTGFYAAPGSTPLWVDQHGLRARGRVLIEEIRRAADYGLDPNDFDVDVSDQASTGTGALAAAEVKLSLAATKYTWHAHGGRVDPAELSLWLDQSPRTVYASSVISELSKASDPAEALRLQHPRHPQFELLRQAYIRERDGYVEPPPPPLPLGPAIAEGSRNADVAVVRERLGLAAAGPDGDLLDEELADEISRVMRRAGYKKKRVIDDDVRKVINARKPDAEKSSKADISKYLANLERWRSVPHDFGQTHIWNNLPEFETRFVKNGVIVHRERIIIGQPHTQTPVFSDAMSHVIFQPTWGLPPSIKLRQFGARLRGGDTSVLERRNMKIIDDGRVIRPSQINWAKVDIRHVPIVQGPGPGNPLGRLKFMFPNAHDVYMHDTPDKYLFNSNSRAFSHGCMRLRNPEKFAEVVLGDRLSWSRADIERQLKNPETTQINLRDPIPVHITYFTVVVDEETGKVRSLADIYGHDKRISEALAGVPVERIAARDPAMAQLKENQELAKRGRNKSAAALRGERFAALGRPRSAPRPAAKPAKKKFFLFSNDND